MTGDDLLSLLSLDSFASDESARVAVYGRAMRFCADTARPTPTEEVADAMAAFVDGQRWRLEALDVALDKQNRRSSLEHLLESAGAICAWVTADPAVTDPVTPDPAPAPAPPASTRKSTRRKRKTS